MWESSTLSESRSKIAMSSAVIPASIDLAGALTTIFFGSATEGLNTLSLTEDVELSEDVVLSVSWNGATNATGEET